LKDDRFGGTTVVVVGGGFAGVACAKRLAKAGPRRRELHGLVAFASWLGVHAWLLSGFRARAAALASWGLDYVANVRPSAIIDRPDAGHIDWD
jgi:NADH:ubiquinone reductase (H+-translocating)